MAKAPAHAPSLGAGMTEPIIPEPTCSEAFMWLFCHKRVNVPPAHAASVHAARKSIDPFARTLGQSTPLAANSVVPTRSATPVLDGAKTSEPGGGIGALLANGGAPNGAARSSSPSKVGGVTLADGTVVALPGQRPRPSLSTPTPGAPLAGRPSPLSQPVDVTQSSLYSALPGMPTPDPSAAVPESGPGPQLTGKTPSPAPRGSPDPATEAEALLSSVVEDAAPATAAVGGAAILAKLRQRNTSHLTDSAKTLAQPPGGGGSRSERETRLVVAYGSQTGTSEEIARSIAAEANEKGYRAQAMPLNDLGWAGIGPATTPLLVLVSSSTGDGDPPDNAANAWVQSRKPTAAPLHGVRFTVLGLGDSNYTRFMHVPRAFKNRLLELGASPFYPHCEADEVDGIETKVEPWLEGLWPALAAAAAGVTPAGSSLVSPAPGSIKEDAAAEAKALLAAAGAGAGSKPASPAPGAVPAANGGSKPASPAPAAAAAANGGSKPASPAPGAAAATAAATAASPAAAAAGGGADGAAAGSDDDDDDGAMEARVHALARQKTTELMQELLDRDDGIESPRASNVSAAAASAAVAAVEAESSVSAAAGAEGGEAPDPEALERVMSQSESSLRSFTGAGRDSTSGGLSKAASTAGAAGAPPSRLSKLSSAGAASAVRAEAAAAAAADGGADGLDGAALDALAPLAEGGEGASAEGGEGDTGSVLGDLPSSASLSMPSGVDPAARGSGFRKSVEMRVNLHRMMKKPQSPRSMPKPLGVHFPKREETVVARKDEQTYGLNLGLAPVGVDTKGAPALIPSRLRLQWEKDAEKARAVLHAEDHHPSRSELSHRDPSGLYSTAQPYWAYMSDARYETAFWSDRKVLHVEFNIKGAGMEYAPGDALGLQLPNSPELVVNLLKRLNLNGNKVFAIQTADGKPRPPHLLSPCSVATAFLRCVDITSPPRKSLLRMLSEHCGDAAEKRTLLFMASKAGKDAYQHEMLDHQPSLLDILSRFTSCSPPLDALLDALPPLAPRYYSITCAPATAPHKVQVALSVVRFKTRYGPRLGVASTALDRLAQPYTAGMGPPPEPIMVPLFLKRSADFRLPEDISKPIIMVGPGTGVAPFRGFLQQRRADAAAAGLERDAVGEAVLFFGCRLADEDYLYKDDFAAMVADKTLTSLYVAFSRAQATKVYVQDLVKAHGEEVWKLVDEKGGHVYICGDGAGMAKDVHAALQTLIMAHGGKSADEAAAYLTALQEERRYCRDVWS